MFKHWLSAALFALIGVFFAGHGVSAIVTGEASWFRRFGPQALVKHSEAPVSFLLTVLFYGALTLLFLAMAAFFVWSGRETRESEKRYFRQKSLLEPERDQ